MQIPSSAIAASVSTIASSTKTERTTPAEPTASLPTQVESSGESNADRDAQGQGDGMGQRDARRKSEGVSSVSESTLSGETNPAPTLPDEPPSQLDLVG